MCVELFVEYNRVFILLYSLTSFENARLEKEKFKSDDFQKWFLMMVLNLSFLKIW